MVFIKNPVLGKVKTRLAKSIGDEKALNIYNQLLHYTLQITEKVNATKAVFYSDYVDESDEWKRAGFLQYVQRGDDLGERMHEAFAFAFSAKYKHVVIIGSDCAELTPEIIEDAFQTLDALNIVLGPAADGGYYLLGMTQLYSFVFSNKSWSTNTVLQDTIKEIEKNKLNYALLNTLSDIDEVGDLATLNIESATLSPT